jgi:hypothetical protein
MFELLSEIWAEVPPANSRHQQIVSGIRICASTTAQPGLQAASERSQKLPSSCPAAAQQLHARMPGLCGGSIGPAPPTCAPEAAPAPGGLLGPAGSGSTGSAAARVNGPARSLMLLVLSHDPSTTPLASMAVITPSPSTCMGVGVIQVDVLQRLLLAQLCGDSRNAA